MKVRKTSGKPFKSGKLINTVKATVINEQDPKQRKAYTFEEDDSVVNCDLCEEVIDEQEAEPVITMSEAVAIMKEKVDEQKNLYLRAVADLTNYKRNAEKTIADSKMNGEINVLKTLLPILDDIDRAASAGDGDNPIYKKLQSSMQSFGLECIEPLVNTPFNVDEQCAVMTQPAEGHEVNTIAGIITPGYRYKNTMIRYANVVVYA